MDGFFYKREISGDPDRNQGVRECVLQADSAKGMKKPPRTGGRPVFSSSKGVSLRQNLARGSIVPLHNRCACLRRLILVSRFCGDDRCRLCVGDRARTSYPRGQATEHPADAVAEPPHHLSNDKTFETEQVVVMGKPGTTRPALGDLCVFDRFDVVGCALRLTNIEQL
jgi:hypothetical protein